MGILQYHISHSTDAVREFVKNFHDLPVPGWTCSLFDQGVYLTADFLLQQVESRVVLQFRDAEQTLKYKWNYMNYNMTKPTKWVCAQRRLRSAWASAQSVRMNKTWVLSHPLSAQRRLWSDWADAQADLCLRWTHTHFVGFVAQIKVSMKEVIANLPLTFIVHFKSNLENHKTKLISIYLRWKVQQIHVQIGFLYKSFVHSMLEQ